MNVMAGRQKSQFYMLFLFYDNPTRCLLGCKSMHNSGNHFNSFLYFAALVEPLKHSGLKVLLTKTLILPEHEIVASQVYPL